MPDTLEDICSELNLVAGEWLSSFCSLSAGALCWAIQAELEGKPADGYPPAIDICDALIEQEADPNLDANWVQRTRDVARRAKEYMNAQSASPNGGHHDRH